MYIVVLSTRLIYQEQVNQNFTMNNKLCVSGPSLEAKPPKLDDDDNTKPESSVSHGLGNLYFPGYRVLKKKASACHTCLKILFVILSFIVLVSTLIVLLLVLGSYAMNVHLYFSLYCVKRA